MQERCGVPGSAYGVHAAGVDEATCSRIVKLSDFAEVGAACDQYLPRPEPRGGMPFAGIEHVACYGEGLIRRVIKLSARNRLSARSRPRRTQRIPSRYKNRPVA